MAVVIGFGGGGVITGNDSAISVNTTLDTTKNWSSMGPVVIQNGITVTVNTGAFWNIN
jgi:hypothetical protein